MVLGVALFAFANFSGRLGWGYLSDHIGASLTIIFALLFQAVSILSLILFPLTDTLYLVLSVLIGFGFGGNFVLFAKESAQVFGVKNLGLVYPYVFQAWYCFKIGIDKETELVHALVFCFFPTNSQ